MTVRLPAWLQTGTYTAETDRFVPTGLLTPSSATAARGGVRRWAGNEFQVVPTTPTATMQVTVKAGMAWIQGAYSSVQGVYVTVNDGDVNLALGAAHASLARIDLVVLEILDSTYSGASNTAQLRIVQGTPLSTPTAPAVTGSYIVLASIRVGAGTTSIATSAITDVRPYATALGGILPVKDKTSRLALTGLPAGTEVLEVDTGRVYQYGYGPSGGWIYVRGGTSPTDEWITPTLLNNWSLYGGTGVVWRGPRYRKTNGMVEIQGIVAPGAASAPIFQLPAGYRPNLVLIFSVAAGTNIDTVGRIDVYPNGDVRHVSPAGVTWMSMTFTFTPDQ